MIEGKQIKPRGTIEVANVNYREIKALNASMIKLFATDPVLFYDQFVLGNKKKDKKSVSLIIGDIVDFYILDCLGDDLEFENRFDEKFSLFNGTKGSGQVFILADELYDLTLQDTNDEGIVTTELEDRLKEALSRVQRAGKYKGATVEKAFKDFSDNGYEYFNQLVTNIGKTVVETSLLDKAKKVAQLILNDKFTSNLFAGSNEEIEYFPKFAIEWKYIVAEDTIIDCKSEIDMLLIDHSKLAIYPKDLKTTYDNENFEYGYTKYRYDLQAAFYHLAVKYWAIQNDMSQYKIKPMEFIVADTSVNNRRPIRYQISQLDLDNALMGYSIRGQEYEGLFTLINNIVWAGKTDNWNVSRTVFDNNGKLPLNIKYD